MAMKFGNSLIGGHFARWMLKMWNAWLKKMMPHAFCMAVSEKYTIFSVFQHLNENKPIIVICPLLSTGSRCAEISLSFVSDSYFWVGWFFCIETLHLCQDLFVVAFLPVFVFPGWNILCGINPIVYTLCLLLFSLYFFSSFSHFNLLW